jgi:lycopene beta-cyclase
MRSPWPLPAVPVNAFDGDWDVILVGAGLANGLIAWRLKQAHPNLRILVLEQGATLGGNHTWSFHDSDLTAEQRAWIAPLVAHRWSGYDVTFPALTRRMDGGYNSIASADFARVIAAALGDALHFNCRVTQITPMTVTLENGPILIAKAVIDGRGVRTSTNMALGYQTFLGQEVRLAQPHGLTAPVIMDATVAQDGGYRFVYLLPFTPDTLLIEDTHYVDHGRLDAARCAPISRRMPQRAAGRSPKYCAKSAARCRSRWPATSTRTGTCWPASLAPACAPACSTRRLAIRCRTRCGWPS